MKRLLPFLLALILLGCGRRPSPKTTESGVRIVSLSPSVTYTLQQIGCDERIVGRTSYCPPCQPGHTSKVIGNVLEINLEEILLLKPDIVFSMAFTKVESIKKLEAAGIKVQNYRTPINFEQICEQTLEMGKLIGMEEAARKTVDLQQQKVARIREQACPVIAQKPYRRVFFQIGDSPVFPVIEGSYMHQYLSFLGLENIVKDYKGGGINKEYVLTAAPDVMFISNMSGMGKDVLEDWLRYPTLPAVANGRITLIDDTKACCPSPVFFAETLQTIADYFCNLP